MPPPPTNNNMLYNGLLHCIQSSKKEKMPGAMTGFRYTVPWLIDRFFNFIFVFMLSCAQNGLCGLWLPVEDGEVRKQSQWIPKWQLSQQLRKLWHAMWSHHVIFLPLKGKADTVSPDPVYGPPHCGYCSTRLWASWTDKGRKPSEWTEWHACPTLRPELSFRISFLVHCHW